MKSHSKESTTGRNIEIYNAMKLSRGFDGSTVLNCCIYIKLFNVEVSEKQRNTEREHRFAAFL